LDVNLDFAEFQVKRVFSIEYKLSFILLNRISH